MLFLYIGDYPENGAELVAYGRSFAPGKSVDLPEPFATKARGNRFFVEAAEAPAPVTDPPAGPDITKPELIAMADAASVTIDRRWSAERIRQAILTAASELPQG